MKLRDITPILALLGIAKAPGPPGHSIVQLKPRQRELPGF